MKLDNPACYECPKGKNKLHTWSPIIQDGERDGAICLNCSLILTESQAAKVWGDND